MLQREEQLEAMLQVVEILPVLLERFPRRLVVHTFLDRMQDNYSFIWQEVIYYPGIYTPSIRFTEEMLALFYPVLVENLLLFIVHPHSAAMVWTDQLFHTSLMLIDDGLQTMIASES